MKIVFIFICLLAASCATRISTVSLLQEADSTRIALMRSESHVYGDFFKLRIFHEELIQVTSKPEKHPYTALDSIFKELRPSADSVIIQRMIFDSTYNQIRFFCNGPKKKKVTTADASLIHNFDSLSKTLPDIQSGYFNSYLAKRASYEKIKTESGIKRLGMEEFASLIDEELVQWQDSLEEVGRIIGKEKSDLSMRFPIQKGPEFFAAYQPVSEMEVKLKGFISMVSQLENSLSRFEEGNKQDYIYYGPFVRVRMEVQATDNIVSSLALMMQEIRELDRIFWLR